MPNSTQTSFFVLCHNIRSLYNVGAIFRTADVFAIDKIFLSGYSGTPEHAKLAKVSLGTEKTVPWEYQKTPGKIIRQLRGQYPRLIIAGLENHIVGTRPLPGFRQSSRPLLLVLGEEAHGITPSLRRLCDVFLEIPQMGQKESLNVSVAFGIAAYQIAVRKDQ